MKYRLPVRTVPCLRPYRMFRRMLCCTALCMTLFACSLSPSYHAPELTLPGAFKYEDGWKTARPGDFLDKGKWWALFGDPILDDLMERLNAHNQNIAIAAANLRQARAEVMGARAAFLPKADGSASLLRQRDGTGPVRDTFSAGVSATWELSFWNVLPAFEAARAATRATAADYATVRLAVQAELAQTYFQLRTLDAQRKLYEETTIAYKKAVELTTSQYRGGIVTPADVAQAETQLASAEAELAEIERQRVLFENALAVLVGEIPSAFFFQRAASIPAAVPDIPSVLPSELLERRPDVAAAERRVASANERIGIARAAWFPVIDLGLSRVISGEWLRASHPTWAVGPSAALSLFDGGRKLAGSDAAWAAYDGAVADYRLTVLEAFRDVEDNLSSLLYLEKQAAAQDRAVTSSRTALRLALSQYKGGLTTYLQVVTTQAAALDSERRALEVQGQRLVTSVGLIKALGGGWQMEEMSELARGNEPPEKAGHEPER